MMTTINDKSYSEMQTLSTFEERFSYVKLHGDVGEDTFGYDRFLNQDFYKSREWKQARAYVIARDNGCDLGIKDRPISGHIYVHHINPLTKEDIINCSAKMFDPDNLVCVSQETHNAIHYGDESIVHKYDYVERSPDDQCPWK